MQIQDTDGAVVLFSGGLDSTTCAKIAINNHGADNVLLLSFSYNQKHRRELEQGAEIAEILNVKRIVVDLSLIAKISESMLLDNNTSPPKSATHEVKNRNMLMATVASSIAIVNNYQTIYFGVNSLDDADFPDCRVGFIEKLEETLKLSMSNPIFKLKTPLINLQKHEIIRLASDLGIMDVIAHTHTCYNGESPPCGKCPSCLGRAEGFRNSGILDPIFNPIYHFSEWLNKRPPF